MPYEDRLDIQMGVDPVTGVAYYRDPRNGKEIPFGALYSQAGLTPVALQSFLWAARPDPVPVPYQMIHIRDVNCGQSGTGGGAVFISNGQRWKPMFDMTLDAIDTANVGVANTTEQQLAPNHVLLPAGLIGNTDRMYIDLTASKSGTTDNCTIRLRFGPAGTVADPVIATITSMAGASQSLGTIIEFKRISATSIQKMGSGDGAGGYSGASTNPFPAPITVANMDSNGMYLSVTAQMGSGTEVPTIQDMMLKLRPSDNT